MTLSEELTWRGFVNQTTYKDITALDGNPITFYLGVDPSASSMTVGNLAVMMMVRHFIDHGHKAILLTGGATGIIGDPDGKKEARELKALELVAANAQAIAAQFSQVLAGKDFDTVNNYDWFNGLGYLEFLREIGMHVPMRQMLGREFVQSRLSDEGSGLTYAEFSYSLIQGYDFLHLHREKGASLQICGADQWGNSIAGVDLIRRITGDEAHVWSAPLVVNKATGIKFGKSEAGAVWLDPIQTTPTQFYQFWINADDAGVEDYLKIYTLLTKEEIATTMAEHHASPSKRRAQRTLAESVTTLVHGEKQTKLAKAVTEYLTSQDVSTALDYELEVLRSEISAVTSSETGSVLEAMVQSGLASSNSEARRLLQGNAVSVNGQKISRESFEDTDFQNGRLLIRRGKAFKDTALVELQG